MPDSGFGKNEKRRVELVCQINRRHAVNIKLIKFHFEIIFDCPRRLHKIIKPQMPRTKQSMVTKFAANDYLKLLKDEAEGDK